MAGNKKGQTNEVLYFIFLSVLLMQVGHAFDLDRFTKQHKTDTRSRDSNLTTMTTTLPNKADVSDSSSGKNSDTNNRNYSASTPTTLISVKNSGTISNVFKESTTRGRVASTKPTTGNESMKQGRTEQKISSFRTIKSKHNLFTRNSRMVKNTTKRTFNTRNKHENQSTSEKTVSIFGKQRKSSVAEKTVRNNKNNSNSNKPNSSGCPEMCVCPDYDSLAKSLVPILRGELGSKIANFTDYVLKVYLLRQFQSHAESPASILGRLTTILAASGGAHARTAVLVEAARFGITLCTLKPNVTLFLDAAAEARMFPQVRYKIARDKAVALEQNRDHVRVTRPHSYEETSADKPESKLETFKLYNISFTCDSGSKVVITNEASLYRYGHFRQTGCEISANVSATKKNLSLIDLHLVAGSISWLQNITRPEDNESQRSYSCLSNLTVNSGDKENDEELLKERLQTLMKKDSVFAEIRSVKLINISLSVEDFSDVLSWFQKGRDLSLGNNGLGDLNCCQLQPSAASLTKLTVSDNGLLAVPPCLLRPSLVTLNLSHNAIADISPLQFPRVVPAPDLDVIDLSDNDIGDVGIMTDMNVSALYLAGNRLTSLDKLSFNRLPKLSVLDLSRNRLHRLGPGTLRSLFWLKSLDLRHNRLRRFDSSLTSPRVLPLPDCHVYLNHNSFSHPPFRADGYDPGEGILIHASDNAYACDCDIVSYVWAISNASFSSSIVDRQKMVCHYPAALAGLLLDEVVFVDSCPVVEACPEGCVCSSSYNHSTVTVDCSDVEDLTQPVHLPSTYPLLLEFQTTTTAQKVAMSLQDKDYWPRVISLNLSGRGLTHLPEFLCKSLPNVHLFDLSFNNLTTLPQCFQSRPNNWTAMEVRLAGNPWSCDCGSLATRDWLYRATHGQLAQGDVAVGDAEDVWCGANNDSATGVRVADWDTRSCSLPTYLLWMIVFSLVLSVSAALGPLLYFHRLQICLILQVLPCRRRRQFQEEDHDYEVLVVYENSGSEREWVNNSLVPRYEGRRARPLRLCVPDRDFSQTLSTVDSYTEAVARSKATLCVLPSLSPLQDDLWLYAFGLARAKNARDSKFKVLLVSLEPLGQREIPEEVLDYLHSNDCLCTTDRRFWRKLDFYMPDPPRRSKAMPEIQTTTL